MATYTVSVLGVCTGGEHIKIALKKDGVVVRNMSITKTEIFNTETNLEEALIFFLRQAVRAAGATTLAQAKTAVEATQWVI